MRTSTMPRFMKVMVLLIQILCLRIEVRVSAFRVELATGLATKGVEQAVSYITAADTLFGDQIEAAAVDRSGSIFASNFGGILSSLGQVTCSGGNFIQPCQKIFFDDSSTTSFYNGLRFLPSGTSDLSRFRSRAVTVDMNGHRVVLLSTDWRGDLTSSVFCRDSRMTQPNDVALATRTGRVYMSGQSYTSNTVVGDGDLWLCEAPGFQVNARPVTAIRLGVFGRTNGIEVSPDEQTLYLSEAFNKNGSVVSNVVWKFAIDSATGYVSERSLFVDFQQLDGSGHVDVDGMRTDVDGNLFITRNGRGEVVKVSPEGEVLLTIQLPGIMSPTNLDFGGPNGTTLFVVGSCANAAGKGCVDKWESYSAPGRAFTYLNSY